MASNTQISLTSLSGTVALRLKQPSFTSVCIPSAPRRRAVSSFDRDETILDGMYGTNPILEQKSIVCNHFDFRLNQTHHLAFR